MRIPFIQKKLLYLDFASSTPTDPRVARVMQKIARTHFANPSAIHSAGVCAKHVLEESRATVARAIGAHADEIIFTSGGTESDNLAIMGVVRAVRTLPERKNIHIITTPLEHGAVRETLHMLALEGVLVTILPVDEHGFVKEGAVRDALTEETVLVSVMYANNEIGTIEPIAGIAKEIRHFKKHILGNSEARYPLLHTDAAQMMEYETIRTEKLGADMISWNGAKLYGPKGVGALFLKRGTPIAPIMFGGGQERGMRPGTENLPAIAGFAEAMKISESIREKETARMRALQTYAFSQIEKMVPRVRIRGSREHRVPNNIHLSIPEIESDLLVIELDARGIAVSAKSACASNDPDASYVIEAIEPTEKGTHTGNIRISFGRSTTRSDVDRFLKALRDVMQKYRA